MKTNLKHPDPYIRLQRHLDNQPVGFPATASGAEIRILKHIFTPDQACIAACLSHRPEPLEAIHSRACHLVPSPQDLQIELSAMAQKGGIELHQTNGQTLYCNAPLVVGMYELQVDRLTPKFIQDFKTYSGDRRFGLAFLGTRLPQMRTIPIQKSILPQTLVSPFDGIHDLIENAEGPFVILECICRKKNALQGGSCKKTQRTETCLALGAIAGSVLGMGVGREISRAEARAIMDENQKEGLVLQPANAKNPDFICSCCSCCCGMLGIQKSLPVPVNFWAANFQAVIDQTLCTGCGICQKKCQVDAIGSLSDKKDQTPRPAAVDKNRCIGCGLCVPACPVQAVTLFPNPRITQPPETRQELHEILLAGKKERLGKVKLYTRLARDMIRTGDLRLLQGK